MAEARSGIFINKRSISTLDFQFRHELDFQSTGWRMLVVDGGRLVLKFLDGGTQNIDVAQGDLLFSSGEDIYFQPKP